MQIRVNDGEWQEVADGDVVNVPGAGAPGIKAGPSAVLVREQIGEE